LLESADEGALDRSETDLLDWLSQTWNIKIEIEPEPEPDEA